MKKLLLFSSILFITLYTNAQIVNIPDANFKTALLADTLINTNQDLEIQLNEALAFTGQIDVSWTNISNITGLEAFTNITSFICEHNLIDSLNTASNIQLRKLICKANNIDFINFSENLMLDTLNCSDNNISSLNVSNNNSLLYLDCGGNPLGNLNIENNIQLKYLNCLYNNLDSLNIDENIYLEYLQCSNNYLSMLDISNNFNLTHLYCGENLLTSLNLDNNTALTHVFCFKNQINEINVENNNDIIVLSVHWNNISILDLSNNYNLVDFFCYNNTLEVLNLKNGNNVIINNMQANNNPNLFCIQVDDSAYSATNWTAIDTVAYFSEDCGYVGVSELQTPHLSIFPIPTTGFITIQNDELRIKNVSVYDIYGKEVYSQECHPEHVEGSNFKFQNTSIDLSSLPHGIYIISIITDKQTITQKIIKQ